MAYFRIPIAHLTEAGATQVKRFNKVTAFSDRIEKDPEITEKLLTGEIKPYLQYRTDRALHKIRQKIMALLESKKLVKPGSTVYRDKQEVELNLEQLNGTGMHSHIPMIVEDQLHLIPLNDGTNASANDDGKKKPRVEKYRYDA